MEKVSRYGLIILSIMEIGMKIKLLDKEYLNGKMVEFA